jgi:DNA-binding transcriptional ArsR family regulator
MPERDDHTIERAAGMLRAAADPGRMRVLAVLLDRGEMGVGELAELTGSDASTTSHRLRILASESLVKRRADGRHRFYSLADRHVESLLENILDHADPSISIT